MVSVKAAATGKVSWGPMVMGLGPLEHPAGEGKTLKTQSTTVLFLCILNFIYEFCTEDWGAFDRSTFGPYTSGTSGQLTFKS